jgi:hypothetical protein
MGVRRVSKKLGWRGDEKGLKAKARRGMCSKTEVAGAHGVCCDGGALLREGAIGAQQQLVVKASLCCWCATPTSDADVRRDARAQRAVHAWKTMDLHLKMLMHLKLSCSEMLTGLPAVEELETGSEWSCRGRKLLVLARKLAIVLEGLSTWRLKSRREVEGRREELLWVEERRVGAVGSVVYILLLQGWETLKTGSRWEAGKRRQMKARWRVSRWEFGVGNSAGRPVEAIGKTRPGKRDRKRRWEQGNYHNMVYVYRE